jgi:hypothetical protein
MKETKVYSRRMLLAGVLRSWVWDELTKMLADDFPSAERGVVKEVRKMLPERIKFRLLCDDYEALKVEDIMLGHKRRCRSLEKQIVREGR